MALRELQRSEMDGDAAAADSLLTVKGTRMEIPAAAASEGEENVGSAPSLQEAFQRFRHKRKEQFRGSVSAPPPQRTPEYKEILRATFLEKALSYQGVPYAARFHTDPSSPHHNAPLYLDCCGLVRRVLRDLQSEFGFVIGRYNQSYQFDTLPLKVTKEEMQPGDLVFLEAPYYDKDKKPQTHNMQHVEIWLGDGDKTLGARFSWDVVRIHDSYDFVSKRYGPNKYHFCSIDTWLDGVCKSHRRGFPWPDNPRRPAPGSIFAPGASTDQQQAAQEGDDADADADADADSANAAAAKPQE